MVFILLTTLFSVCFGVFVVLASSDYSRDAHAGLALLFLICAAICFFCAVEGHKQLVARQQLLEQKCIQAGIAEMKAVATEARFEFIEVSAPAEKPEP